MLDWNKTELILCEKHMQHRKFLDSLAIEYSPDKLCNNGPSMHISEMWFGCVPTISAAFGDAFRPALLYYRFVTSSVQIKVSSL